MDRQNFDLTLKSFAQRQPFRPFEIRFVDGRTLNVDHPEALVIVRGGTAFHMSAEGNPTLFDYESVSSVSNAPKAEEAGQKTRKR